MGRGPARNQKYSNEYIVKMFDKYSEKVKNTTLFYSMRQFLQDEGLIEDPTSNEGKAIYTLWTQKFAKIQKVINKYSGTPEAKPVKSFDEILASRFKPLPSAPGAPAPEHIHIKANEEAPVAVQSAITNPKVFVYVDCSNLLIEGRRLSAVKNHYVKDMVEAKEKNAKDNTYQLDYTKLAALVVNNKTKGRLVAFGSFENGDNEFYIKAITDAGFELFVHKNNNKGKEKGVDMSLGSNMTRDAYKIVNKELDSIILISGDGDFTPTVDMLIGDGYNVSVMFWDHANFNLKQSCKSFTPLDELLMQIGYRKATAHTQY